MAIGLIVILKQLFILFGYKPPKTGLIQLISYIPNAMRGMEIEIFLIGIFAIVFIVLWKKYLEKYKICRLIPVYLVVIILTSLAAFFLDIPHNQHYLMRLSQIKLFVEFFAILIFLKRTYISGTLTFQKN